MFTDQKSQFFYGRDFSGNKLDLHLADRAGSSGSDAGTGIQADLDGTPVIARSNGVSLKGGFADCFQFFPGDRNECCR